MLANSEHRRLVGNPLVSTTEWKSITAQSSPFSQLTADSSLLLLTISSPFKEDKTETIHHKTYLSGFSLYLMSWASLSVPFTVFL